MSAATIVAQAFGESANLYSTVLGVSSDATAAQLRKAYYKRALLYHPDKQSSSNPSEVEDAKLKFQAVSVAYTILSDPEKRSEYDDTGELYEDDDDMLNKTGTDQWTEYFRGVFGKVTTDDIDSFEAKYKCSDEERADVLKYYGMFKGDLNKMLECVMLSSELDKKRWVEDYITPAIDEGEVEEYREALDRTLGDDDDDMEEEEENEDEDETESEDDDDEEEKKSSRKKKKGTAKKKPKKKAPPKKKGKASSSSTAKHKSAAKKAREAAEAEDLIAKIRGNALARRQRGFDDMMAGLEERYSGGGGGAKKKKGGKKSRDEPPDIPDDEFERIQAQMMKKGKRRK